MCDRRARAPSHADARSGLERVVRAVHARIKEAAAVPQAEEAHGSRHDDADSKHDGQPNNSTSLAAVVEHAWGAALPAEHTLLDGEHVVVGVLCADHVESHAEAPTVLSEAPRVHHVLVVLVELKPAAHCVELHAVGAACSHALVHEPCHAHLTLARPEAQLCPKVEGRDVAGALAAAPILHQRVLARQPRGREPLEVGRIGGGNLVSALFVAITTGARVELVDAHEALAPEAAPVGGAQGHVPARHDRVPEARILPPEAKHVAHNDGVHHLVDGVRVEERLVLLLPP
mmetsp:Transcript_8801/g.21991  ORF Transcript_8801/g.21991 Transcript_8801/m.21991 type:complete len:288 (-) Transcript_8801:381-1244(-)